MRHRLLERQTITPAFSWELCEADCVSLLSAAYSVVVESRHGRMLRTKAVMENIRAVASWLSGNRRQSGLLLCGGCGNGKTTMAEAIAMGTDWLDESCEWFWRSHGSARWQVHPTFRAVAATDITPGAELDSLSAAEWLRIEDLGCEPLDVQSFGNITQPVVRLLERRYAGQLTTIITTNLSPRQVGERYGERVRDRFRESVMVVAFDNASFRGPDIGAVCGQEGGGDGQA